MKPLRIAFLTDYLGTLAGTEASLVAMAVALAQRGHAAAVAIFPREEPVHPHWRQVLDRAGIPLFVGSGDAGTACREIAYRLASWGPDLVHGVPMGRLLLEWIEGGYLRGLPRVATETSEASPRCTWYDPLLFDRFSAVDAVIAPCASVAAGLRQHLGYGGPIATIPHIVAVREGAIRPMRAEELGPLTSLGAITRLRSEKGIEFLLAALALLPAGLSATLTIHGEAPERERTEQVARALGVADRLCLAGPFKGDDEIDAVIGGHCLLGLSSLFEGLPLAILHAIARGRVVVSTDVGGAAEILEPGGGLVVPPGDARAMSDAFAALIQDPALVLNKSVAAVATFRDRFHADRVMPQLIAFYNGARA